MHMTATLTKWYEEHGRHEIFAGGKKVQIAEGVGEMLTLKNEIITTEEQRDLDVLGIAKNSREEKMRARAAKNKQEEENARMAKLYREHVLGEKPAPSGFVSLDSLAKPKAQEEVKEEVYGD
jgi:hypothetical protein